jgi:hypothetical protein
MSTMWVQWAACHFVFVHTACTRMCTGIISKLITTHRLIYFPLFFSLDTGIFEMIVWVLTTYHTQYTWDRNMRIFLFNRTTIQVFATYLTGALYVHLLWFYEHQHDNSSFQTSCSMSAYDNISIINNA